MPCLVQRVVLKQPVEGDFSVESDREVMKLLQKLAELITVRLERGDFMSAGAEPSPQMNKALLRTISRKYSTSA